MGKEAKRKVKTGAGKAPDRTMGPAGVTIDPLISILQAAQEAQLLHFALDKKLFDYFGSGKTAADISSLLGYDARKAGALLDAYVSMGLLHKAGPRINEESRSAAPEKPEGGQARKKAATGTGTDNGQRDSFPVREGKDPVEEVYRPTALTSLYLRGSSPFSSFDLLQGRLSKLIEPEELEEKLSSRSEQESEYPPAAGRAQKDPEEFTRVMVQHARSSGGIRRLTALIAGHPRFYRARRALDLGGGHGLYTAALCRLNPRLEGIIYDLPGVAGVSRKYIQKQGLENRIKAYGGDFYQDNLGRGYQIALAVNVFHRSLEMLRKILQKVYAGLDPGGVLYLQHRYLNEKRTAPREAVHFYLSRALEVDSFYLPTTREALDCSAEAGFCLTGLFRSRGGDTCLRLEKKIL